MFSNLEIKMPIQDKIFYKYEFWMTRCNCIYVYQIQF